MRVCVCTCMYAWRMQKYRETGRSQTGGQDRQIDRSMDGYRRKNNIRGSHDTYMHVTCSCAFGGTTSFFLWLRAPFHRGENARRARWFPQTDRPRTRDVTRHDEREKEKERQHHVHTYIGTHSRMHHTIYIYALTQRDANLDRSQVFPPCRGQLPSSCWRMYASGSLPCFLFFIFPFFLLFFLCFLSCETP
ncbi:hypothetical protein F4775DRAFT_533552 [Biscogniauxia sp. FL1348]|nr:hypothetical protein F4775DRAFT_533552 [Biscogniauxia sp. FL1348]